MKYFLDTEFIEYPNTIQLISIGLVREDGKSYYAISSEFDSSKADDWVMKNVILKLEHNLQRKPIKLIRKELIKFISDGDPEFWGYYSDYDWVVFCWIFGKMIDLPTNYPKYCNDLKQSLVSYNLKSIEAPVGVHNALVDAKWNFELYKHIFWKKLNESPV